VEGSEELPVLRLVGRAGFAPARGALEPGFELRRVQSVEELDEGRTYRQRRGLVMRFAFVHRFPQPLHGIDAAALVLHQELEQQLIDGRAPERRSRIVRLGRWHLDTEAVANLTP